MTYTVVKVENLSKQYRIGAKEGYKTFRKSHCLIQFGATTKFRYQITLLGVHNEI